MTITQTFNEVSLRGTKTIIDANGKKRKRTMKFWQTINPFNKNAKGEIKNRAEIMDELKVECAKWKELPE